MKKTFAAISLIIIVFVLSACSPNPIAIGERAPNFKLRNLDGEEMSLRDNRGQPVLINFWGVWCPPCTIEMPAIIDRSERYDDELVVMAVNYGDRLSKVQDFVEDMELPFSPYLDLTGDVQDLYLISGYPTSVFVDSEGVIQMIHVGYLEPEVLDEYLGLIGVGADQ